VSSNGNMENILSFIYLVGPSRTNSEDRFPIPPPRAPGDPRVARHLISPVKFLDEQVSERKLAANASYVLFLDDTDGKVSSDFKDWFQARL